MTDTYHRWRPHPWHGLEAGPGRESIVHAFVEITPFDTVKYEVDKPSGYLKVDRPQRTSSAPPTLYGFVPQTYCADRVGALVGEGVRGDGDPLDICVISERRIDRAEVIINARVIGGLQMIDGGEADDKIIAILESDYIWTNVRDASELPGNLLERLQHYFMTYKLVPGQDNEVRVEQIYGRDHALAVVRASLADYAEHFGAQQPHI